MGLISDYEILNRLVYDFFWEVRDELKGSRALGNLPEHEKSWCDAKRSIGERFGIAKSYLKSLQQMRRKSTLHDFLGVIHWMQSCVKEEYRQEVQDLLMDLLMKK